MQPPRPDSNIRWDPRVYAQFSNCVGKTRVSLQNYFLATRSLEALVENHKRFAWLLDPLKVTVLGALGRLDDRMLVLTAAEICDRKLTSKPALAFVRRVRGRHRNYMPNLIAYLRRVAWRYIEFYEAPRADVVAAFGAVRMDLEAHPILA